MARITIDITADCSLEELERRLAGAGLEEMSPVSKLLDGIEYWGISFRCHHKKAFIRETNATRTRRG